MDLLFWVNFVVAVILGTAIGSFLNVVSDRLPAGQSLVSPPSHCPVCDVCIRNIDLIPVLSYLALMGKCRNCSSRIPIRTLVIEVFSGLMMGLIWAFYGWSYQGIALMAYASLFLAVFIIDVEHQIIPNKLVLVGLLAALVIASFWPGIGPVKALLGAAAGFSIFLVLYLIPGFVIGEGDVKLAAVVGAATGFPVVVVSVGLSFMLGGTIAILLLATRRAKRKGQLAFGPFIALAAMITILWGQPIFQWYASRFLAF